MQSYIPKIITDESKKTSMTQELKIGSEKVCVDFRPVKRTFAFNVPSQQYAGILPLRAKARRGLLKFECDLPGLKTLFWLQSKGWPVPPIRRVDSEIGDFSRNHWFWVTMAINPVVNREFQAKDITAKTLKDMNLIHSKMREGRFVLTNERYLLTKTGDFQLVFVGSIQFKNRVSEDDWKYHNDICTANSVPSVIHYHTECENKKAFDSFQRYAMNARTWCADAGERQEEAWWASLGGYTQNWKWIDIEQ